MEGINIEQMISDRMKTEIEKSGYTVIEIRENPYFLHPECINLIAYFTCKYGYRYYAELLIDIGQVSNVIHLESYIDLIGRDISREISKHDLNKIG